MFSGRGMFNVSEINESEGTATIMLDGELDYSIYTSFKNSINDLVGKGILHVTYDLSKLVHIQSLGIGIIMWSYVELDSRGGTVTIVGANNMIKKVFCAAQLDTIVKLV